MKQNTIDNNSKFKNLPYDDFYYVVVNYGVTVKLKNESSIPNIQVILRKIDIINNIFIENTHDTVVYLPFTELDDVRIGSVWVKQNKFLDKWKYFAKLKYIENVNFNFDFIKTPPEIISFSDHIDSLGDTLENVYKINFQNTEKNLKTYFNKTKYVKLVTNTNQVVLISCLELFISTYAPKNKEIKKKLFQLNLDDAINEFLNLSNSKIENNVYYIGLNKLMKHSNIKFLAYAKFNQVSRKRISYLYSSLEYEKDNDLIFGFKVRYPEILPYNPRELNVEIDGLSLNEKTFLIQRINKLCLPCDIKVIANFENKNYEIEEKFFKIETEECSNEQNKISNDKTENDYSNDENTKIELSAIDGVDSNKEPRGVVRVMRTSNQVVLIDEQLPEIKITDIMESKVEYKEHSESENIRSKENYNEQNLQLSDETAVVEQIDLSDGDKHQTGGNSKKILYTPCSTLATKNILFDQINTTLEEFKKSSFIKNYNILDEDLNKLTDYKETTFYETLLKNGYNKQNLIDNWYFLRKRQDNKIIDLGKRGYFLIEIEKITNKYVYILEILTKDTENHYLGSILKNDKFNKLNMKLVKTILEDIVKYKGHYNKKSKTMNSDGTWFNPIKLGVDYATYYHKFDNNSKKYINLKKDIENKIIELFGEHNM